jgi:hypothetical protein
MLDALGNIGDFVGGIAVIATLIYLAVQVKQNTVALKAASWQEAISGAKETSRFRSDPIMSRSFALGLYGYPELPPDDLARFGGILTDETLVYQGVFALHQAGQLDDSVHDTYLGWYAAIIQTPGGQAWWEAVGRPIFVPEMVSAVDERLSAGSLPNILELPGFEPSVPG